MKMYYSKSTGGFYSPEIHGDRMPSDAAKITTATYNSLLAAQSNGKSIVPDENGNPIAVGPVAETPEQIIAKKIAEGDALITARLDAQARALGFDNITTAVVNASLPIGEYKQDVGAALLLWRARTWQKAEQIRDAFFAGERPEPTWEEVESELPTYPIDAEIN